MVGWALWFALCFQRFSESWLLFCFCAASAWWHRTRFFFFFFFLFSFHTEEVCIKPSAAFLGMVPPRATGKNISGWKVSVYLNEKQKICIEAQLCHHLTVWPWWSPLVCPSPCFFRQLPLQLPVTKSLLCARNTYLSIEMHPNPMVEPILGAGEKMLNYSLCSPSWSSGAQRGMI